MTAPTKFPNAAEAKAEQRAMILAAIRAMDTLDAVDLLTDAWEEVATDATDAEMDQLTHVMQGAVEVRTVYALEAARKNLRDYREAVL